VEWQTLCHTTGKPYGKRICQICASGRYGQYLRLMKTDIAVHYKAALHEQELLDCKVVVHSNDDTLNAEDIALGYKKIQRIKGGWRTLKSGTRLRPVYH